MKFFDVANGSLLFVLVGAGIAYVLVQCVLFLRMSLRRARELGIDPNVVSNTIKSSAVSLWRHPSRWPWAWPPWRRAWGSPGPGSGSR
ncbi:MAG: DUF5058 family protein [Candidatus Moduliflexus flocculans]|nr:DUF5058 family protein [Candidatus Moduliflexus flocculans]